MIRDIQELSASLRYASSWADKLEALREHSAETEASLLSTTSTGPLAEVRRVLTEAREFAEQAAMASKPEALEDYRMLTPEREKVA